MRLLIVTLSAFTALCLASTTPSCFSKKSKEKNTSAIIGTLYTDPVYCPPCQWLEKELEKNPDLLKKIVIKKIKLDPDSPYPKDYPENQLPDDIGSIPTLQLNNGELITRPDSILKKLMED